MGGGRHYEDNPEVTDDTAQSRTKLRENAQKVSKTKQKDLPDSATKISYGKRFAKTEEMYQARVMEKELEELARADGKLDDDKASKKTAKKPAPAKKMETAPLQSRHEVLEQVTRGAPIGSVPPVAEPPPRGAFSDVLGDAQRYWGMLRGGLRDAGTAGIRLAKLPVDLAVMAVGRLRPNHA